MSFTTRKSLLEKVRNGDEVSWREFYDAYKPLVWLCGQDCNLTPDENEELVQRVMVEIFSKNIVEKFDFETVPEHVVFKYDPGKGRFRHYLRKIIRYQAIRIFKNRVRNTTACIDADDLPPIPSDDCWEAAWNEAWRKHVLNMALAELKAQIQPETYVAFEMYAIQNRPVQEVADFLNFSVSSVYTAKSRCIASLKEIIRNLEER